MVVKIGGAIVGGFVLLCLCGAVLSAIGGGASPNTPASRPVTEPTRAKAVAGPAQDATATPVPTPTDTPEPTLTPAPTATLSPVEALRAIAAKHCGGGVITADLSDSGNVAIVECRLADNFSNSWMTLGALDDIREVSRDVFTSNPDVERLTFRLIGDFKSETGDELTLPAFTAVVTRELAEVVKWDNLNQREFGRLLSRKRNGSSIVAHPAWRSELADALAG